jgi:hypothetical protein
VRSVFLIGFLLHGCSPNAGGCRAQRSAPYTVLGQRDRGRGRAGRRGAQSAGGEPPAASVQAAAAAEEAAEAERFDDDAVVLLDGGEGGSSSRALLEALSRRYLVELLIQQGYAARTQKNAGEGGGQILRMGAALAAITKTALRVHNIRAGRATPGLRPQHLCGLRLVTALCTGELAGGSEGSLDVTLRPGPLRAGAYEEHTRTAGSCTLLAQVRDTAGYTTSGRGCTAPSPGGRYGDIPPAVLCRVSCAPSPSAVPGAPYRSLGAYTWR